MEIIRHFSSWHEFVTSAADQSLAKWTCERASHEQGRGGANSWQGTSTFNEAVDMALYKGWPEGRELLSESLAIVSPRPEPYKSLEYDVAGAFPLVPLYLTGDPAHMVDFPGIHTATSPVVRIDYSNSVSAYITPKSIMLRGAAVLSLCNMLERRGYSVELRLVESAQVGSDIMRCSIIYKKAGRPFDLDSAAFAIAHPSTLRRLNFAIYEQHPEIQAKFHSTYGYPIHKPFDTRPDTIFISSPERQETKESALEAVKLAAKRFLEDKIAA